MAEHALNAATGARAGEHVFRRPFELPEYKQRLAAVRKRMTERDIGLLICTDPCNMNYLSGYDGWSFHQPQCLLVSAAAGEPVWIGRITDSFQAAITSFLSKENIEPYPERYFVRCLPGHPFDFVAEVIRRRGWGTQRIGLEVDTSLMTALACESLKSGLPQASFTDAQWLVDRVRAVKSAAELHYMEQAARIVEHTMSVALDKIAPGVRQCDLAAEIISAQVRGVDDYHGDYTSVVPLMPTGTGTSAPHLTWTAERYVPGEATIIEVAGCRYRYHVPIARTVFLGKPPQRLLDAAKFCLEAIDVAIDAVRPGAACEDVERAWRKVISKSHLVKDSRIGYTIGMGYPPDWCGNTTSFFPGDKTIIERDMTFHMMPGIWMEDFGIEISEPVHVTAKGARLLANVRRELIVK